MHEVTEAQVIDLKKKLARFEESHKKILQMVKNYPAYAEAMDAAVTKLEELGAANARLKLALLGLNLSPVVVKAVEKGE